MRKIFAVIGLSLALALLLALPVSAETWPSRNYTISKSDGLWVVTYEPYISGVRAPLYVGYYFQQTDTLLRRVQVNGGHNSSTGVVVNNVGTYYGDHEWHAADFILSQKEYDTTTATLYSAPLDLSGLPLGVDVTFSVNITGSMANISEGWYESISLYALPSGYAQRTTISDGDSIPEKGTKLNASVSVNPGGTGAIVSYTFTSTGSDSVNFGLHFERYAGYNYGSPLLVIPQFTFKFTSDQLEQVIASQKYTAGLTKEIADALKADPQVQKEIQDKKEEQSQMADELSRALEDMSMPDIDISIPDGVSLDPDGIDKTSHIMSVVLGYPGVMFIVSTTASLWIVALLLFGKREGGAK